MQTQPSQDDTDLVLSLDAFVRSIGVNNSTPHSLFLGAGASISSGVPSAQMCIWEWKRHIFLTNNPGLEDQFSELSLAPIRQKIQSWLNRQGHYPADGSPHEYGVYIEACFPIQANRRTFFEGKIREAKPHIGYRLLCHLAEEDLIRFVWSTNFDGLSARAAGEFKLTPLEVGLDTAHRLCVPARGQLLCVALHGDYRYDHLRNTPPELQTQDENLRNAFIDHVRDTPLIVIGYSGRDASVMEAFHSAYSQPGSGILHWCGWGDDPPPQEIAALIRTARRNGRNAFYIPSLGFDDTLKRLGLHCSTGERREAIRQEISRLTPDSRLDRAAFEAPCSRINTLIKSNAFAVECPAEVFAFDLHQWPSEKAWAWVREAVADHPVVAVPYRGKILAFGTLDGIKAAFGANIKGQIERTPITADDLRYEDGVIVSLMRDALVRSMAVAAHVETDGRGQLWLSSNPRKCNEGGVQCHAYDAALVFLRRIAGTQYVVLKPSLRIFDQNGVDVSPEIANLVKMSILSSQYNKAFNASINMWRDLLFPKGQPTAIFEFPTGCGSTFKFHVRRSPIFAGIASQSGNTQIRIPEKMAPLIKHHGFEVEEPRLIFSGNAKNVHPILGLVQNRPYDHGLVQGGFTRSVRLGVVCPQAETNALRTYLSQISQTHRPTQSEKDYLIDFPGFAQAYGLPIEIPEPGSSGWVSCPEPSSNDPQKGSLELAHFINRSVETLDASCKPSVTLIFIPHRWRHLRGFRTDEERFDLHDFVKAFCVQRGVASQFLEEHTLSLNQRCRIWWWLSLAFYAKSLLTPWVLDGLDDDTAFVGLGFSIDPSAERGRHVVLGCSHIYSARGQGLQYRLSKLDDPLFLPGNPNPFMSEDDAQRLGETIRHLFFESRIRLPRRVVIHKRTPFLKREKIGLFNGLSGVEHIEMLEIQIDDALRYVASAQRSSGEFYEDNYPVRRGSTIKLDEHTALAWVHGSTTAVNPKLKYFQGKRRIPAPLLIRRHVGRSDLKMVAEEIIGLSKMNWNTFDLYTKMPATVDSSNEIARIGSLLQRFGAASYDYRLFI